VIDTGEDNWEKNDDPWSAWMDFEKTGDLFILRARQAGDVIRPLGMGGQSVKVREFFINQKIPQGQRNNWPIVCAGAEIAWIPGMRIAHPFRVTKITGKVVRMTMKKIPVAD
jgi:tRNA(Ile)-lysidine synthase